MKNILEASRNRDFFSLLLPRAAILREVTQKTPRMRNFSTDNRKPNGQKYFPIPKIVVPRNGFIDEFKYFIEGLKINGISLPLKDEMVRDCQEFIFDYLWRNQSVCKDSGKFFDVIEQFREGEIRALHMTHMMGGLGRSYNVDASDLEYIRFIRTKSVISERFGDILLISAIARHVGYNRFDVSEESSVAVSPFFSIEGGNLLYPHTDDVTEVGKLPNKIGAVALVAIKSTGRCETYFIPSQNIFENLSPESQKILQMPIFYCLAPIEKRQLNPDLRPADLFAIFQPSKEGIHVNYDANFPQSFNFIENEFFTHEDMQKALKELYVVVCKQALKESIGIVLKNNEGVLFDHQHALHGRRNDEVVKFGNLNFKNQVDFLPRTGFGIAFAPKNIVQHKTMDKLNVDSDLSRK